MKKKKKLLPAAIYVRRSCARSNDRSCKDQRDNCLKIMQALGYYLVHEKYYFEDDIISGLLFYKRPGLSQILGILETERPLNPKPFEAIIIDDVSRLARNLAFCILFVQALRFHDIKLFDSRGNEYTCLQGYCLLIVMGMAAEIGRNFLSWQTARGIRAAVDKKKHLPGKVFGFAPQDKEENDSNEDDWEDK